MNIIKKNIPNSITCLNLISGVLSIICGMQGDAPLWGLKAWEWGFIFIGTAAVADFMDGFMARLLHAYSDMGKELDSLCDLVSFGVAPAIAVYSMATQICDAEWIPWLAIVIAVAGGLRLAKFNVDTRQSENFIGLPIPANAIFWIGYITLARQGAELPCNPYLLAAVILAESWLMVSELPLFSLKFKTWGWRGNAFRWILISTAVVMVACMGAGGLMWLIVAYVLYGIFDSKMK